MTPRERVLASIAHKQTDIPPINIETTHGFDQALLAFTGEKDVSKILCNHMLRVKYKKNTLTSKGERDLFGVDWQPSKDGGDVGTITRFPLAESMENYQYPEINKNLANEVLAKLAADDVHYTMFSITMGFFERAWSLRGMENLLMDMAMGEAQATQIFDAIFQHHDSLLDYVLDKPFDAVYFGDDWGQQQGLIMGPPLWRKYIKPYVSRLFYKIKQAGKQIVLHSCGDLRSILGDLVDMGVDVYNTVQPEIYDLVSLKREYGKDLTFYGGISTQQFLPFATPKTVLQKTKNTIDILFRDGGYILSPTHAVTQDIPVENIIALRDAGLKYQWR